MSDDLWHDLLDANASNLWLLLLNDCWLRCDWQSIVGLDLLAEVEAIILLAWLHRNSNLALLLQQSTHPSLLLTNEGHLVQLLSPCLGDLDGVGLDLVILGGEPLVEGMLDDLLHCFRMECVPAVVHVGFATLTTFGVLVWEELSHARRFYDLLVEIEYSNLVEGGRITEVDFRHLEQLLLST